MWRGVSSPRVTLRVPLPPFDGAQDRLSSIGRSAARPVLGERGGGAPPDACRGGVCRRIAVNSVESGLLGFKSGDFCSSGRPDDLSPGMTVACAVSTRTARGSERRRPSRRMEGRPGEAPVWRGASSPRVTLRVPLPPFDGAQDRLSSIGRSAARPVLGERGGAFGRGGGGRLSAIAATTARPSAAASWASALAGRCPDRAAGGVFRGPAFPRFRVLGTTPGASEAPSVARGGRGSAAGVKVCPKIGPPLQESECPEQRAERASRRAGGSKIPPSEKGSTRPSTPPSLRSVGLRAFGQRNQRQHRDDFWTHLQSVDEWRIRYSRTAASICGYRRWRNAAGRRPSVQTASNGSRWGYRSAMARP